MYNSMDTGMCFFCILLRAVPVVLPSLTHEYKGSENQSPACILPGNFYKLFSD